MQILEVIMLCLGVCLCALCTKTDIREGKIKNKDILVFFIPAVIADIIYYGFFVRDIAIEFIINFLVIAFISLYLFFSHSFAGGDTKLSIVLALLYPGRFYIVYRQSNLTLIFALCFAIFFGYCYLFINSIFSVIKKKTVITGKYIKKYTLNFLQSYFTAMIYIIFVNMVLVVIEMQGVGINIWISRLICVSVALCAGRFHFFKNKIVVISIIVIDIISAILLKIIPFSVNPGSYVLVLVLMFCQMTIRTNLYEEIKIQDLKKGMILSAASSVILQTSGIRGLPGISTEDLKSRLTEEEIKSISKWGTRTKTESIIIVKKIPFAVFISMGYVCYFVIRSILS